MCNISGIVFGAANLMKENVQGKSIIEVGALDVNGSLRPILESVGPKEYIGVDMQQGPGVDVVCNAEDLLHRFGAKRFDIVVSTELLEHVKDWRKIISNMKNICKPGGIMLITTRSKGFPYHAYPYDFWRYEEEDMKKIFSDFIIEKMQKDSPDPGIFLKLKKPADFHENDLSTIELYSMIVGKRVKNISEEEIARFKHTKATYFSIKESLKRILNLFRKV